MEFKIKSIILWPQKENTEKKIIPFNLDSVNVIVGDSQTGKSAIIPIIDYCLASSKCYVPVGPIRNYTNWFGILIQLENQQLLLARKSPENQSQSSLMYIKEGEQIEIPENITANNTTVEFVTNRLNVLFRLPNLDFHEDSNSPKKPYENKPSYKDFLAFCFQPQHIIANPYTLFYKADTVEHRFKLQMIFPLALGLIKSDTLEIQKRIKELEDELNIKKRELEEKKKIVEAWKNEFSSLYTRCIELGILKDVPFPEKDWTMDNYIVFLKEVPSIASKNPYPNINNGVNQKYVRYISNLTTEEGHLLEDLEESKIKLKLLNDFSEVKNSYQTSVNDQLIRLEVTKNGWLEQKLSSLQGCPFCGNSNDKAKKEIQDLLKSSSEISLKTKKLNLSTGLLDKERLELDKHISEIEKQINSIRDQLNRLNRDLVNEQRKVNDIRQMYLLVGKIERSLESIKEIRTDSTLHAQINDLEKKLSGLRKRIDHLNTKEMQEEILSLIGNRIVDYKEILKVEDFKNSTKLDIKQLTLKIKTNHGKNEDYLWEIGSGSNWLGYHISTILALHEYFLKLKENNFTPSFIVFDQPTQTYFPQGISQRNEGSDDIERVHAIFKAFLEFYKKSNNNVQIIVLEHADQKYWGKVENTKRIGPRWNQNNDTALIPKAWM